jgi:hypothetical protein
MHLLLRHLSRLCLIFLLLVIMVRPFRRSSNNLVAAGVHLALVFVYAAACLIKIHQSIAEVFISTGDREAVARKVRLKVSYRHQPCEYRPLCTR